MIKFFRKHYRIMISKDSENIKIAAFHESGHIALAYMSNWAIKKVEIIFNEGFVKYASTTYEYGNDEKFVRIILNIGQNTSYFNNLSQDEKGLLFYIAEKRLRLVLGGPISEKRYLMKSRYKGKWEIDQNFIRSNDYEVAYKIHNFLQKYNSKYNANYFEENIFEIANIMTIQPIWLPIKTLANELISSKDYILDKNQIEIIFNQTGFFDFINKILDSHK